MIANDFSTIVIGAGLAGSAVASRLTREGWPVTVLDAAHTPAQGASSLPVGLMAPMISREDTQAARLTREGVRATLDECRRLTQTGLLTEGVDWQANQVIQRSLPNTPRSRLVPPPDWPADNPWIRPHGDGTADQGQDWLHLQAAWIKPLALVRAWLATPGVQFTGDAHIQRLERQGNAWQALDASGRVIASATHIVIAAATGTNTLLQSVPNIDARQLPTLNPVAGQIAYAPWTRDMQAALPESPPYNGNGHFIPNVHREHGAFWLSGSTYEHTPLADDAQRHEQGLSANIERATSLLPPALSTLIREQHHNNTVQTWQSTRCTSPSRLPVVQTLAPGLHICTAMGSRGLTFAWHSACQLHDLMKENLTHRAR